MFITIVSIEASSRKSLQYRVANVKGTPKQNAKYTGRLSRGHQIVVVVLDFMGRAQLRERRESSIRRKNGFCSVGSWKVAGECCS